MNIPFQKQAGNQALNGLVIANTTSAPTSLKIISSISAPAAGNDSSQSYSAGSIWIQTTSPANYWTCVDNTAAAAVWLPIKPRIYTDTGAANAYVCNNSPEVGTSYTSGIVLRVIIANSNTGASTINLNGLGAKNIYKNGSTVLSSGDMPSGGIALLIYDGTQFQLINPAQSSSSLKVNNFRITLSSGTPVTTGDITAATTVYVTPYQGNQISLYDGTSFWATLTSAQMSIAVPNTTSTIYDLFCYNNSGVATLETTAWASATARATALTLQDGIYVRSGATTRRYLGSFRTTGVAGQTEDSLLKRYVYNAVNRAKRPMQRFPTGSWTYTVAAVWRQWNASTANQIEWVDGLNENAIVAESNIFGIDAGDTIYTSLGLDSTTTPATGATVGLNGSSASGATIHSGYTALAGIGYHFLAGIEAKTTAGVADTATFYGTGGLVVSGIIGEIWS